MRGKFADYGYEQDPRAAAVDDYTATHLLAPARNKHHDALEHAYNNSLKRGLPDISCYPSQGKYLAIQVRMAHAKNILEVGTLGGYSSIWMATAGLDVHVTTVEVDEHHKAVAEENIAHAGLDKQIDVVLGSGLKVLPKLRDDVKTGKRQPFDFVFIDADKQNNLAYFNLALEMTKSNTGIFVDNVVRNGKLADPKERDERVVATRKMIEEVGKNDRVDAVVLQTVSTKNYDGFMMAVTK